MLSNHHIPNYLLRVATFLNCHFGLKRAPKYLLGNEFQSEGHLARSLPTLLLPHGFKTIQTRCNRLLKGDLEWLWASCTKTGRNRQTRLAANPHTGKARTTTQLDALAQKLARAGNFSKSCQAVCSVSTPSLGPHTLAKLQAKNPQGSVNFKRRGVTVTGSEPLDGAPAHDPEFQILIDRT